MEIIKNESQYNIIDWFKKVVLENYVNFEGRARRSEYWYYTLAQILLIISVLILGSIFIGAFELEMLTPIFGGLYVLLTFGLLLPSLGVAVRRLHDTGKSGWFILLGLVPFGGLILLVFYLQDSDLGHNKWGPNPKQELNEEF
ncbi:DUF805 domain-containing protein [Mesohalobacter salilacus]|uniref:DUF805 domain-containing protein n=1 Tax=Mesohalobacter salilacus TaxID=2491711 RepID=UPI0026A358DA